MRLGWSLVFELGGFVEFCFVFLLGFLISYFVCEWSLMLNVELLLLIVLGLEGV